MKDLSSHYAYPCKVLRKENKQKLIKGNINDFEIYYTVISKQEKDKFIKTGITNETD